MWQQPQWWLARVGDSVNGSGGHEWWAHLAMRVVVLLAVLVLVPLVALVGGDHGGPCGDCAGGRLGSVVGLCITRVDAKGRVPAHATTMGHTNRCIARALAIH